MKTKYGIAPRIDAVFAADQHYEDHTVELEVIARAMEIALRDCINLMWARGANVSDQTHPDLETVRFGLLPQERAVFDRARLAAYGKEFAPPAAITKAKA